MDNRWIIHVPSHTAQEVISRKLCVAPDGLGDAGTHGRRLSDRVKQGEIMNGAENAHGRYGNTGILQFVGIGLPFIT
ncbi:hypothetical protein KDK_52270 [Dictyobacter kobayashii]|uniref:Uncharacterized protein n=1 Tax=Dictyobacter kobayashii TaxID=2014872 RepID=A0A402AQQ9_9CHLR|nr:hypothetical protein KDK_52270 [Dictyobacter kobayashii]